MPAQQPKPAPPTEEVPRFLGELENQDFLPELMARTSELYELVTGEAAKGEGQREPGVIHIGEAMYIYCMVRHLAPGIVVETGVCNGLSSAFILYALERNEHGHLHSIDYPEVLGTDAGPEAHWEGDENAVVPEGKAPGWLVSERLRERWTLILGRSQEKLPGLLEELGRVDLFFHDSEHSYECMRFEMNEAKRYLSPGGTILAHDVHLNSAFADFARQHGREPTVFQVLGSLTFD
jgi:predicted O-methyltransferase YrrM